MAKTRTHYLCRACGSIQHRWMGKCPDCGAWDSLEEQRVDSSASSDPQRGLAAAAALGDAGEIGDAPRAVPLSEAAESAPISRLRTDIAEFDRVLGGGIVPGSVVLLGGDPGIGKSTLMLQALASLSSRGARSLYVSSEESADQIRLRAQRLDSRASQQLFVLADTNLARIIEQARQIEPSVIVIDSIQMIYRSDLDASPGSIAQLRRCCTDLVYLAKASGVAIVLVGHVTKDGQLAGPRLLEHLVDVVLSFEGDRYHAHRIVRSMKNRFGTTQEIGLFEMTSRGLLEVPDATGVSSLVESRIGSVICPIVTGSRCLLVEIQALTATGFPGAVRRKASGVDSNRLAMLIAVLEQHAGLRLYDRDVFASAAGGMRVADPAADLALAMAIASAHHRRALPAGWAAVGEVGLGGEVRPVSQIEARLRECRRLGLSTVIVPAGAPFERLTGIEALVVKHLSGALEHLAVRERVASA